MTSRYQIDLTLLRDQLGTNPCDPNVMDAHILDRQRKLILEKSKINTEVNKYLDALTISKDRGDVEVNLIFEKLEAILGYVLSPEDRIKIAQGDIKQLKETFVELDLKGSTVFFWNKEKDRPMIGDHMIYGFMKAAAEAIGRGMPRKNATMLQSISYTQSIINQHCRCVDQFITFDQDIRRLPDGEAAYLQRSLRAETAQGPRITLAKSEVVPQGAKLSFVLKVMDGSPLTKEVLDKLFAHGEFFGLGQWRNVGYGMFEAKITPVV